MKWDSNFSFFCLNITAETMCYGSCWHAFGALFPLLFHVARVVVENLFAQGGCVDMRIDFGCSNVLMTEHRLNGTQVCPTLQQRRSETMAQGVGRDGFLDTRFLSLSLDHDEYHRAGEMTTTAIEEHKVFLSGFDIKVNAVGKP